MTRYSTSGPVNWTMTYDADGLRTKRTDGTNTYTYSYIDGQLWYMKAGSQELFISWDAAGNPWTLQTGGQTYYYVTNLQGDVTAILNGSGDPMVTYTYDAWGNILEIGGEDANTLGRTNPLRYRGYVYDQETGLYYLQSRYYDPEMGRFISADAFASTGQGFVGNNMFAYCGNNPVINADNKGTMCHAVELLGGKAPPYIYDQSAEPHGAKKLQNVTVSYGGCGVVAAYNALITLGNSIEFNDVLSYFNEDPNRTFLNGYLGILPGQLANFFNSLGYRTITTNSIDEIDILSKQADACIMFYMFPREESFLGMKLSLPGAHFVEYEHIFNHYVGRNTSTKSGISSFLYPSDYFYRGNRMYAEAIFIFE